ncbi:MAG: DUF2158 domain-containing protein [Roseibium sp.]|uniref:YodC family protein n=1 Tax=Roseibium sp. TaxID=1936156 RepID=UPI00263641D1|nr:DUF2158 domain-containing protein [Roseibium sp.]MCV0427563.1 DUF2158 domain-containing protein [Roseibium sp.]
MEHIFVHGDYATGKTLNRDLIADYFDCDGIIDGGVVIRPGSEKTLVLCQSAPELYAAARKHGAPLLEKFIFSIEGVREKILSNSRYSGLWIDPEKSTTVNKTAAVDMASNSDNDPTFDVNVIAMRPANRHKRKVEQNTVSFMGFSDALLSRIAANARLSLLDFAKMQGFPENDSPPCKGHSKPVEFEDRPHFKQGSIVRLKSGGQPMTILDDTCSPYSNCGWFEGNSFKEEEFHVNCLCPTDVPTDDELPF